MIALIGTHGVGKTTLLKAFGETGVGRSYTIRDGDSRMVKSFNKETGGKLTSKDEQILINRISDSRWGLESQIDNLCLTRTPLDHYAYCKAFEWHDLAANRSTLFRESDYKKVKFFYIPIEFQLEDDGVRFVNPSFQREIDDLLVGQIQAYGLNPVALRGSVEQRLEILTKNL